MTVETINLCISCADTSVELSSEIFTTIRFSNIYRISGITTNETKSIFNIHTTGIYKIYYIYAISTPITSPFNVDVRLLLNGLETIGGISSSFITDGDMVRVNFTKQLSAEDNIQLQIKFSDIVHPPSAFFKPILEMYKISE